jgi:uncharacterized cupredoxin-like copper-binding protein
MAEPAGICSRMARGARAALMPLALAGAMAACSSSTTNQAKATQAATHAVAAVTPIAANATTTEGELIVAVTANDFSFALNRASVPAGRVHVQLVNQSKDYEHEVWVYPQQQPKLQEMLTQKRAGKDVEELDYLQGVAGHVEDVPAGQTAAFDASLTPGTYELSCFIASDIGGKKMVHYDMGMHTLLTVQ